MKGEELLRTADRLAGLSRGRPLQADLRRAVSTSYYAVFWGFAGEAANRLAGSDRDNQAAWTTIHRAMAHGQAKDACLRARKLGMPAPILKAADIFVRLQEDRHAADYDPSLRLTKTDARTSVKLAREALANFRAAPSDARRSFAIHLLHKSRG